MTVIKNKSISKLIIGSLALMLLSSFNFPLILQNGSGSGYLEGEGSGEAVVKSIGSIEAFIIRGAGYYLEGTSCIRAFLTQYELKDIKGLEPGDLEETVTCALKNITLAVETYTRLVKRAKVTPYNPVVIEKLKRFGYEEFREQLGLQEVIFTKVKRYLERGEITGSLKHTLEGMKGIRELLKGIKKEIEGNRWPEVRRMWKVNEESSEVMIFGSYAARVFSAL